MSERIERNYCRHCRMYSVLPNHCDNCGDVLSVAPLSRSTWFKVAKWTLLLAGFFFVGVALGFGLALLREFNR